MPSQAVLHLLFASVHDVPQNISPVPGEGDGAGPTEGHVIVQEETSTPIAVAAASKFLMRLATRESPVPAGHSMAPLMTAYVPPKLFWATYLAAGPFPPTPVLLIQKTRPEPQAAAASVVISSMLSRELM